MDGSVLITNLSPHFCHYSDGTQLHKIRSLDRIVIEKYSNADLIIIDSDDEDEKYEILARFMPSHLINEMDTFRDNLVNLIQRALE